MCIRDSLYAQLLGFIGARDYAAVVVAKHHNGPANKRRIECPLAAYKEIVAVSQSKHTLPSLYLVNYVTHYAPNDKIIIGSNCNRLVVAVGRHKDNGALLCIYKHAL